jgi:hypothetical protein
LTEGVTSTLPEKKSSINQLIRIYNWFRSQNFGIFLSEKYSYWFCARCFGLQVIGKAPIFDLTKKRYRPSKEDTF